MTAYAVTGAIPVTTLSIKAITWQLRVVKLEFATGGTPSSLTVSRVAGVTISGGSTVTAVPLRDGAQPATFTAKTGSTVSGTSSTVHFENNPTVNAPFNYQFPFDLIVNPGDGLHFLAGGSGFNNIWVYLEELHLVRSS